MAQDIRFGNAGKYYSLLCKCIGSSLGGNVSSYTSGYVDILAPAGTPVANTWMRVGTAMAGTTYQVFLNGALIRTATGLTALTTGNIAFDKYVVPPGTTVWIDDVVARRYANPGPTSALGVEGGAP